MAAMTVTAAFGLPTKKAPPATKTGTKTGTVKKAPIKKAPVKKSPARKSAGARVAPGGRGKGSAQRSGNSGPNRTLWYPSGEAGRFTPAGISCGNQLCVFLRIGLMVGWGPAGGPVSGVGGGLRRYDAPGTRPAHKRAAWCTHPRARFASHNATGARVRPLR